MGNRIILLVLIFGLALSSALVLVVDTGRTELAEAYQAGLSEETFVVPFNYGTTGVQSSQSYSGLVNVTVEGVGQASGTSWSDAFYIYTDFAGQPIEPWHPVEFFNWTLWINGGPADDSIPNIPAYNPLHRYTFTLQASGGPLTFAVGDAGAIDNTGAYTVSLTGGFTATDRVYLPLALTHYIEPVQVPVLVLAYYPPDPGDPTYLDPVETGWTDMKIAIMQTATEGMITAGQELISDATRYHGYKDPTAPAFLRYVTHAYFEYFEPMPRGYELPWGPHRPDYGLIMRAHDICQYVDDQGVKEVWIYGYHSSLIEPDESKMSSKYGDISNAWPKDEAIPEEFRLPLCSNSYVMYNFTYQPGGAFAIGNTVHNRMHQIENVIAYADHDLFWEDFSELVFADTQHNYLSSCGNAHYTPNWETPEDDYDYNLTGYRQNNCETWHPDEGLTTYIEANCVQWGCTDVGFYKWYMQNMPGLDNGIQYGGQQMRNWWEAMHDFNRFIDSGRSLYQDP